MQNKASQEYGHAIIYFFQVGKPNLEVWKSWMKVMLATISTASWSNLKTGTLSWSNLKTGTLFCVLHPLSTLSESWLILVNQWKIGFLRMKNKKILLGCLTWLKGYWYLAIPLLRSSFPLNRNNLKTGKQRFSYFSRKHITHPEIYNIARAQWWPPCTRPTDLSQLQAAGRGAGKSFFYCVYLDDSTTCLLSI